jgi:hypothetical protein
MILKSIPGGFGQGLFSGCTIHQGKEIRIWENLFLKKSFFLANNSYDPHGFDCIKIKIPSCRPLFPFVMY